MESISDNTLMSKVKDGDLDKLGLLFERYHRMLYAFFFRMHKDTAVSEDLVQDVFTRILKYRKGFKGDGSFKVWMFHIARNVSHDQFRTNKKFSTVDLESWTDKLTDFKEREEGEQSEFDHELLHKALDAMDPSKKELIVMSKLTGIKYRHIAEMNGTSEGNVKVQVFRALKDLKEVYVDLQRNLGYEV